MNNLPFAPVSIKVDKDTVLLSYSLGGSTYLTIYSDVETTDAILINRRKGSVFAKVYYEADGTFGDLTKQPDFIE